MRYLLEARTLVGILEMLGVHTFVDLIIKRLVLAWDPDYTKLTAAEKRSLEIADKEMKNGEFYTKEEVCS